LIFATKSKEQRKKLQITNIFAVTAVETMAGIATCE
jgi:hypothetical protein